LSAVLGGTQSLHTNSYDEALSLPSAQAAALALRTQQIIAFESGAANVVDPLAGSYYVENLTDKLETEILNLMKEIEDMGGALKAVETGFYSDKIVESAYNHQKMVESGEKIVVGVNKFQTPGKEKPEIFRVDDSVEAEQLAKLVKLRSERDNSAVNDILGRISNAAYSGRPLMPLFIEGAEKMATLGEMCGALRDVFGEYDCRKRE
jgi:methylmalonyl-CoA mutase, N-terminal domain